MFRKAGHTIRRSWLWVVAGLSIVCGSAWSFYPAGNSVNRLQNVPLQNGEFRGHDVELTGRELKVLGRVDLLHRKYALPDRSVYVTVIDGSKDRHAVHDPRYCFQGAGWKVLAEQSRPVPGGESSWLAAERDGRRAEAAFWFTNGDRRYASVSRYLWETVLRRVSFGHWGGAPVLVVVQSYDGKPLDETQVDRLIGALHL